jgi:uncharacterized protein YkwD
VPISRSGPLRRWSTVLLALAILASGCGSGSDEPRGLDGSLGDGNGEAIRKAYAAVSNKSVGVATVQAETPPPDPLNERLLAAVNVARAEARKCGDQHYPAVPPLAWDVRVANAALLESEWMLQNNRFGHEWDTGELVWDRLELSGYRWSKADENIAAGFRTIEAAMQAWIDSPPHCVALMRADIVHVGVAVVPGRDDSDYLSYWTMALATPR